MHNRPMRTFAAALFLLLFGSVTAAGQSPATETVKAELRAFVQELNTALQARDRAALERLYAPGFLFVHALGPPVDRETQIANTMATKPRPGAAVPVPSFDGLIISGDLAILRQAEDGRYGLSIYTKASGRWQALHVQGTPTPSAKPAVTVPIEVLQRYVGRYYQQDNKLLVTIALAGDQLTLQVEGRQVLGLTPLTQQQFDMPAGVGTITFAADGKTYEVQRSNGLVVRGNRQ